MSFVYRNGEIVEKGGPKDIRTAVARSELPRPMIISDTLASIVNPIDGKPYDSKSHYYRTVKDAGCTIIGNDKIAPKDNDDVPVHEIEAQVAKAFDQVA